MNPRNALCLLILTLATTPARSQTEVVDGVSFEALRAHVNRLLATVERLDTSLPAKQQQAVRALLDKGPRDDTGITRLQEQLDPRCLVLVSINPESRVKAKRGLLPAELVLDKPVYVLVKVHNEAGVTHALRVAGAELRPKNPKGWLQAEVVSVTPKKTLSGQVVEYVLLELTAREAGKREATLKFDAGQGTQDLGFRAEVPILFTIRKK